jgi:hypothetical protein
VGATPPGPEAVEGYVMKCEKCKSENVVLIKEWSSQMVRHEHGALIHDNEIWKCNECGKETHTWTKRHREF